MAESLVSWGILFIAFLYQCLYQHSRERVGAVHAHFFASLGGLCTLSGLYFYHSPVAGVFSRHSLHFCAYCLEVAAEQGAAPPYVLSHPIH
jgi:hypothetical protein